MAGGAQVSGTKADLGKAQNTDSRVETSPLEDMSGPTSNGSLSQQPTRRAFLETLGAMAAGAAGLLTMHTAAAADPTSKPSDPATKPAADPAPKKELTPEEKKELAKLVVELPNLPTQVLELAAATQLLAKVDRLLDPDKSPNRTEAIRFLRTMESFKKTNGQSSFDIVTKGIKGTKEYEKTRDDMTKISDDITKAIDGIKADELGAYKKLSEIKGGLTAREAALVEKNKALDDSIEKNGNRAERTDKALELAKQAGEKFVSLTEKKK